MMAIFFLNFLAKAQHLVVDASKFHSLWQIYYWLLESEIRQGRSDNVSSLKRHPLRKLTKLKFFSLECTILADLYVSVYSTHMMTADFSGLKISLKEKTTSAKIFRSLCVLEVSFCP